MIKYRNGRDIMNNVVITGNGRGFGYAMTELFYEKGFDVVLCDISKEAIEEAKGKLMGKGNGKIVTHQCDITEEEQLKELISHIKTELGSIDIWINNAGVNQPSQAIWELDKKSIDRLIDIDLKGTILCSKMVMPIMIEQGYGQIYNVEGYGSNDATQLGLSIYGTSKRAVTYFTEALAKEAEVRNTNVFIGKITPGIMITNFISTSLGDGEKIELDEKTKKVYNILGDYPETIAAFMVDKIINNKKNGAKFVWLSTARASWRFMTSSFHKRDFFKN